MSTPQLKHFKSIPQSRLVRQYPTAGFNVIMNVIINGDVKAMILLTSTPCLIVKVESYVRKLLNVSLTQFLYIIC